MTESAPLTIRLNAADNVAVTRARIEAGSDIPGEDVVATQEIPAGHKIATAPIATGEPIRKYNQIIGFAAADIAAGRPPRQVTLGDRGQFLCDYIELLLNERVNEGEGFRHFAPGTGAGTAVSSGVARGRDRWVINKVRALCAWYSKGLDDGSHLRSRVNSALSLGELREIVDEFFFAVPVAS